MNEPATQTEVTPELVPLTEASDADIEAYLKNPVGGVDESTTDASSEETEKSEPSNTQPETKEDETPPSENTEEKEENAETPSPEKLKEENEKLHQMLQQQEQFIQRRNSQFGEVRKELTRIRSELQTGLEEKAQADPLGATKDVRTIEKIDEQLAALENNQTQMVRVHETQKAVLAHLEPNEVPFEDLLGTLEADGVNHNWLQTFKANPYAAETRTSDFIIQLHRRVRAENLLRTVVGAYKRLEQQKGGAPRKQTSSDRVLRNIESAIRSGPSVTASAGGASSKETYDVDPTKMTDAEIEEFLKKNKVR